MAVKASPTLLHQACRPRCSRIPHILTALASKQARVRLSLQWRMHRSTASRVLPSNLPHPSRPPPSSQPTPSDIPAQPTSRDQWALYIASLFGFSLAMYISLLYVGVRKDWERSKTLAIQPDADVSDRWDTIGRNYDDEIDLMEKFMFMGRKRRKLVSQAKGEVLEVSVGTGRNMQYYNLHPWGRAGEKEYHEERVISLTFNDKADVMVSAAEKKFEELQRESMPAQRFKGLVQFVNGDAGAKGVIERPGAGFDTIVQTMGLCSTSDPVGLLRRLGELCRKPSGKGSATASGKMEDEAVESKFGKEIAQTADEDYDGGRILLLEHGRGYWDWLNNVLDGLAPSHADHYGCWWNRDIGVLVEESGLEVEHIKRYHLGTTWEVILRPRKGEEVPVVAEAEDEGKKIESSGLFGWLSNMLK